MSRTTPETARPPQTPLRFTVEAGDTVRVKELVGERWAGKRGVAVKRATGRVGSAPSLTVWAIHIDGFTSLLDFSERELTVMEKAEVAK